MEWTKQVRREYEEIRDRFKTMNFASFQKGDWFASFVSRVLETHMTQATLERVRHHVQGETPEEQARYIIAEAAKSCALSGRLTASLACAAELSIVPTFGFSFPGIGAAVGLAVMTDIGYCLRTHIRSVYDLSVVYGAPLTTADMEDCYLIFLNAMDVKIEDVGGGIGRFLAKRRNHRLVTYNARRILQMGLQSFFQQITHKGGGTMLVRKLVERVNLRLLIPGVNVAIAANFNRRFTHHVLRIADRHMRWRGAVVQPLLELYDREPELDPMLIFQGIIVVVESGSAAEWNRHQLDALRYCQHIFELPDYALASLDDWFDENVHTLIAQLPQMGHDAAACFVEVLVVAAAMSPDTRHDVVFSQAIATIAQATGLPVNPMGIAHDIGTIREMYG